MTTCVFSANFGGFDNPVIHTAQTELIELHNFTDSNFPSRQHSMHPRLRARLPKIFGSELLPGYDRYIWLDGSIRLSQPDSVAWFLSQLGDGEIAVFLHPSRATIHEEADYLRTKIKAGSYYIRARYEGEDLDGQMREIEADSAYEDQHLYASGAFCFRPCSAVREAMREWWYHTSRFHCIDQLAFPYALRHCDVRRINEDIYHASHLEWTKHKLNA